MIEVSNEFAVYRIANGIGYGIYKPGVVIDLAAAKFLVNERIRLFEGKEYPFLVDLRNVKAGTKAAREYFSSDEGSKGIIAGAFVVESWLSEILGNFYLKFSPPPRPTRLFANEREAVRWLSAFKNNPGFRSPVKNRNI